MGFRNGVPKVGTSLFVDGHANGYIGRVIADAALRYRLAESLLQQYGIRNDLQPVGRPRLRTVVCSPRGSAAFVLVRQVRPISSPNAVCFANKPQRLGGNF